MTAERRNDVDIFTTKEKNMKNIYYKYVLYGIKSIAILKTKVFTH